MKKTFRYLKGIERVGYRFLLSYIPSSLHAWLGSLSLRRSEVLLENFEDFMGNEDIRFNPSGRLCLEWLSRLTTITCVYRKDQEGEDRNMSPALASDGVWFPVPKEK